MKKAVAIYARVSKRGQEPRNQLRELVKFAKKRGYTVPHSPIVDIESGAKSKRPGLDRLLELARRREIDAVLVWKLDRLARSTRDLLNTIAEFDALGVQFHSFTEAIDTTTPQGRLFYQVLGAIAEFERELLKERIRAGLDRALDDGTILGRPGLSPDLVEQMQALRDEGRSVRKIAQAVGISHASVVKYTKPKRQ